jgi:hypothetical protein
MILERIFKISKNVPFCPELLRNWRKCFSYITFCPPGATICVNQVPISTSISTYVPITTSPALPIPMFDLLRTY